MLMRCARFGLAALIVSFLSSTRERGYAAEPATGILIVAHGSNATWNAHAEAVAEVVRRDVPAEIGFLMGDGRTPQAAYDRLLAHGVSRIVVVPLLISSHSAHAEQIRFLAGLRSDYPHAEHMMLTPLKGSAAIAGVTPAMDDDPIIAAILADRARALSRTPTSETLVIVAHGPDDDAEAATWTAVVTRLARQVQATARFGRIDVRLLRDDAPKPVKDRALAELQDAVKSHGRSGRVVVVPLLLAPGQVANQIPATLAGVDYAWDGRTLLPDERVAQWVIARARAAMKGPGPQTVVSSPPVRDIADRRCRSIGRQSVEARASACSGT